MPVKSVKVTKKYLAEHPEIAEQGAKVGSIIEVEEVEEAEEAGEDSKDEETSEEAADEATEEEEESEEIAVEFHHPLEGLTTRVFNREIHGPKAKKIAEQFANTHRGRII